MKVFLLDRDQDIDLDREPPPNERALTHDLELETCGGRWRRVVSSCSTSPGESCLRSVTDSDAIVYRQRVLADCLAQPAIVRQMYDIAVDALQSERKVWFGSILSRASPDTILRRSVQILELLVGNLKQLRQLADDHAREFRSEGFVRFFALLADELDESISESWKRIWPSSSSGGAC